MNFLRIFLSFLIFISICIPAIVLSIPIVAALLATKWNGKTTIFGNAKWGKGDTNPTYSRQGYWAATAP